MSTVDVSILSFTLFFSHSQSLVGKIFESNNDSFNLTTKKNRKECAYLTLSYQQNDFVSFFFFLHLWHTQKQNQCRNCKPANEWFMCRSNNWAKCKMISIGSAFQFNQFQKYFPTKIVHAIWPSLRCCRLIDFCY